MEVDSEMAEEVGRKREIPNGSEMDGERRTSRKVTQTEDRSGLEGMDDLAKSVDEKNMKRLVAKWNAENPDATPLMQEELTEQQKAWLLKEDFDRELVLAEAYADRMEEEAMARVEEERDPNQDDDDRDYQDYREHWDWKTAKEYGSFEDRTRLPAMYFADKPIPRTAKTRPTMQIFSVKVEDVDEALHWPLDVFGFIAVWDDLDYNRNIIFERTRDNCQTINEQDPYLVLTGPARAPVMMFGPIYFEVILKVKRTNESEDKDLSLIATRYRCCESIDYQASECARRSCVSSKKYKSKLSTLELTCGIVVSSIEATISVRIVEGTWPDGFSGQFTAFTASVSHTKVSLLKFRDGNVPVSTADGTIELSRRVLSVESSGELRIRAAAWQGSNNVAREVFFESLKSGRSSLPLKVGSCEMQVTVGWSLFPLRWPTGSTSSSNGEASKTGMRTVNVKGGLPKYRRVRSLKKQRERRIGVSEFRDAPMTSKVHPQGGFTYHIIRLADASRPGVYAELLDASRVYAELLICDQNQYLVAFRRRVDNVWSDWFFFSDQQVNMPRCVNSRCLRFPSRLQPSLLDSLRFLSRSTGCSPTQHRVMNW